MNAGLFAQLGMIVIVVFIGMTYIRPTLDEVSDIQDQIFEQAEAFEQAQALNRELSALVSEANAISPSDFDALLTFMPNRFDEIAAMKDIEFMVVDSGLLLNDISYTFVSPASSNNRTDAKVEPDMFEHSVSFTGVGTYEQFKSFLELVEVNDYPLHIEQVTISNEETGGSSILSFETTLMSYSLLPGKPTNNRGRN